MFKQKHVRGFVMVLATLAFTLFVTDVAAFGSKDEKEKYDAVYEGTFKAITDGEMVQGAVVALTKTDVVINIGFKSDGLVSLNEFRDLPNLKVGDVVEVW